jgi:hypothetical protein
MGFWWSRAGNNPHHQERLNSANFRHFARINVYQLCDPVPRTFYCKSGLRCDFIKRLPSLNPRTANAHLNRLSTLFWWALREEFVERNPAQGSEMVRPFFKKFCSSQEENQLPFLPPQFPRCASRGWRRQRCRAGARRLDHRRNRRNLRHGITAQNAGY